MKMLTSCAYVVRTECGFDNAAHIILHKVRHLLTEVNLFKTLAPTYGWFLTAATSNDERYKKTHQLLAQTLYEYSNTYSMKPVCDFTIAFTEGGLILVNIENLVINIYYDADADGGMALKYAIESPRRKSVSNRKSSI